VTRRASRRQILTYTVPAGVSAVAGPAVLAATAGAPTASADGLLLIDFAVRQVPPEAIKAAGVRIGARMCRELIAAGTRGLHFYTLNLEKVTFAIMGEMNILKAPAE
jgi:hypothetical protein